MAGTTDNSRGRSSSPRPRTWSAAESDKCECVLEVQSDDVLLGRGSGPNDHVGNIKFRDLVHERKAEYLSTNHRQTKALIAKDIVDQVYGRGGRFLKKLSPTEAAKVLPKLLAKNGLDDAENDRTDSDKPGPSDVYQIQKHATVMEKAKQALRQNQRNASPDMPENRGMVSPKGVDSSVRRDSMGRANNAPSESPRNGILLNSNGGNNNWNGMSMGNMGGNMGGGFNDNSIGNHNNPRFEGNNFRDTFDMQNSNYNNSPQGRNQDSYQQLFQQHQNLLDLQQQHEMLQLQFQQQRQQQQTQQQLELETHNKLLQEQLELQIRQEQLRQLQQRSLQNIANNAGTYSNRQQEPDHSQSQSSPPSMLNGYATYTTTLDAIEDNRHNSNDGLADPHLQDDKSMQMSTMMGSFKDMSVKDGENESMHGSSGQSIGTIEGVGVPAGFGSTVHMSGISMMSMMNDSTDSLFKNPQKAGNDVGAKNASWGNSSSALADVIESNPNPAAVAAAAVLGRKVPGFEKAQRRWSGGFIPAEVPQTTRRVNRRGSLQYTSNNMSNHNPSHDLNQMQATASAMLAMAQADQERQQQSFNYLNSPSDMNNYGGGHEMMNQHSQGYHMDGMNNGYR